KPPVQLVIVRLPPTTIRPESPVLSKSTKSHPLAVTLPAIVVSIPEPVLTSKLPSVLTVTSPRTVVSSRVQSAPTGTTTLCQVPPDEGAVHTKSGAATATPDDTKRAAATTTKAKVFFILLPPFV